MSDITGSIPPSSNPSSNPNQPNSVQQLVSNLPYSPSAASSPLYKFLAKMMGPEATPKQIEQAINIMLQNAVNQIKQDQQNAEKAAEHLKKVIEEQDDD